MWGGRGGGGGGSPSRPLLFLLYLKEKGTQTNRRALFTQQEWREKAAIGGPKLFEI